MKTISLNDGKIIIVNSMDDVLEIITENLSYDLAEYIREFSIDISGLEEENDSLQREVYSITEKYESLESDYYDLECRLNNLQKELDKLEGLESGESAGTNDLEHELPFY